MKFGKQLDQLKRTKFEGYYIQYNELKKVIKVWSGYDQNKSTVEEVTHWTSSFLRLGPNVEKTTEARLLEMLDQELNRISKFTDLESGALRSQLESLEQACLKGKTEEAQAKLADLGEQLVQLREFAQLNYTGFRKILKKYDKFCKTAASPWFMSKVARAPFMSIDYDSFVMMISRITTLLRQDTKARQLRPTAFQQELVFLVNPSDTLLLKVQLATMLDLQAEKRAGQSTTSVFLDTTTLSTYQSYVASSSELPKTGCTWHFRLYEGENATLVCTDSEQGRTEVAVLRSDLSRALSGDTVQDTSLLALQAAAQSHGLRPMAQASFMRYTFHDRSENVYAILDEHVRIGGVGENLDAVGTDKGEQFPKDVLTVLPLPGASAPELGWLHGLSTSVDIFRAPNFTKAASAVGTIHASIRCLPMPQWHNLFKSEIAVQDPVETFADQSSEKSKGDSETSGKSNEKPMPRIKSESSLGSEENVSPAKIARQRSESFNVDIGTRYQHEYESYTQQEEPEEHANDSRPAPAPLANPLMQPLLGTVEKDDDKKRDKHQKVAQAENQGVVTSIIQRVSRKLSGKQAKPIRNAIVTVQPKTLFSNERTFLEWIHFCIMFAALGIVALHADSADWGLVQLGRGLVIASVCLISWALRTFSWRVESLNTKEIREYHDPVGPPFLIFCLIFALVVASAHAVLAKDIAVV